MAAVNQPATTDDERRVAPRTRTLKRAKILFNNRFSTFDCIVRNISATGALLTIDPAAPLPKVFEIKIGDDEALRPAKLVYRRELFAGIHFLDVPQESEPSPSREEERQVALGETSAAATLRIVARELPHGLVSRFPWIA
ncbi:PilZ domain-containing protein [Aureimonas sp. AU12]|uniref:PilZ domain-containing protein n=1 Tax=Aureimonas sp. AU12 TaxID=1638161 RepID=UPI00078103E0|nr:PilZ domain-containing protein [Aureimonas sp. AU12]